MKLTNLAKSMFVGASICVLAACATGGAGSNNGANGNGAGGVITSGAGIGQGFEGQEGMIGAPGAMRTIYFSYNNDVVRPYALQPINQNQTYDDNVNPTAMQVISACANYLLKNHSAKIRLEGNTDARGSSEYNIALGERRANAVADILKMDGVSPAQITVISYGKEKPIALGTDESAYSRNRRVEIKF